MTYEEMSIRIEKLIKDPSYYGFEAYLLLVDGEKQMTLSKLSFNENIKDDFRSKLKKNVLEYFNPYLLIDDYKSINELADDQNSIYVIEQDDEYEPFKCIKDNSFKEKHFENEDLQNATAILYAFRSEKYESKIWAYQHLWPNSVPNKKRTKMISSFFNCENTYVFDEVKEPVLVIPSVIDMVIIDEYIITNKPTILQRFFEFQGYISKTANQVIDNFDKTNLLNGVEKISEYINRGNGNPKYAKKLMRISNSKVFEMETKDLISKINELDRWSNSFEFDVTGKKIILKTYKQVESLIDLFDERYTLSPVTQTEYDTSVKKIAK